MSVGLYRCPDLLTLLNNTAFPAGMTLRELQAVMEPGMGYFIPGLALNGLGFLLAFLNLGQLNAQLKLLREEEITPADAFSRAGIALKAIGQRLWMMLWVLIWSLPGAALVILFSLVAVRNLSLGLVLVELAYGVSLVLGIRAALRYAMAPILLADRPETGIREAQRESVRMMTGKVRYLVLLLLGFFGWIFITTLLSALIPGILGATVGMAMDLALTVYISTALCAFCMALRGERLFEAAVAQKAVQDFWSAVPVKDAEPAGTENPEAPSEENPEEHPEEHPETKAEVERPAEAGNGEEEKEE